MSYKELFYFIGSCLSLDEHPEFRETIRSRVEAGEIDWEGFVELCSDHLIIPVIYLKFRDHHILELLDDELVQELRKIYELNREQNKQILQQIDNIAALLHPENIYPVFLKGTANLLDGLYCDVGERMMGDIDFLVNEEDFLKAAALLETSGYKRHDNNYFDVRRFNHYPALTKEGEPTYIEIHRFPVDQKYSASLNSVMIFEQKVPVNGKPGLFVPSDEHKLIHTFIHSQLADKCHENLLADFRVLNDLYKLSKRMDVSILAQQTFYPKKVNSWLATGKHLLDIPDLCPVETKSAKRYCRNYNWSLSHIQNYNAYTFLKNLFHTVFMRYGWGFVQLFYSKEQRISVYKRLKDPQWYKIHVTSVREGFS